MLYYYHTKQQPPKKRRPKMRISIKPKTVKIEYCAEDYMGADSGCWRLCYAYYACSDAIRAALWQMFKMEAGEEKAEKRANLIVEIENCPIVKSHRVYA
jgi:hypothetical protein